MGERQAGWAFPKEFGFSGSATRTDYARPHKQDPSGEERSDNTYVEKHARGGRVCKADGGAIKGKRHHSRLASEIPDNTVGPYDGYTHSPTSPTSTTTTAEHGEPSAENPMDRAQSVDGYARGGRVHKAMGGAMPTQMGAMPNQVPGQAAAPMMGAANNRMPGQAPAPVGASNPLSRATVSMPVGDAQNLAKGLVNTGRAVGAKQTVNSLANAARARLGQAGMPGAATAMGAQPRPATTPGVPGMAKGGHITAAERHALPKSEFALPGHATGPGGKGAGSYPIDTPGRARSALSRASANASPAQESRIRAAVHRKYPDIGKK